MEHYTRRMLIEVILSRTKDNRWIEATLPTKENLAKGEIIRYTHIQTKPKNGKSHRMHIQLVRKPDANNFGKYVFLLISDSLTYEITELEADLYKEVSELWHSQNVVGKPKAEDLGKNVIQFPTS